MSDSSAILRLLILAIPVAWLSWTFTHEEVFRELRETCARRSKTCQTLVARKSFYLFTCDYCFSHWCALFFQLIFRFQLVYEDWRGYLIAFAALVWIANIYMNLYQRTRVTIRKERAIADHTEKRLEEEADGELVGAARDGDS
jgi:hypothetical protein